MKKLAIIGAGVFFAVCVVFVYTLAPDHGTLRETVEADFRVKYPNYELLDCRTMEADMVVAYVHIKFRKADESGIEEELWQYWDTRDGWLHRDKYLDTGEDSK